MANIPDFRPQRQIDPMAIVNALAEKRRAEAQLQAQKNLEDQRKYQNIKDVITSVSGLTQSIIQASSQRNINNARNLAINMLETSKDMVPMGEGAPATVSGVEVPTATMGTKDQQPDFLPKLQAAALKGKMEGTDVEFAKKIFPDTTAAKEKEFAPQQGSVELKSGKIIPATFKGGKYYFPNTETTIPPEEIIGKGYGLVQTADSEGNVIWVSRSSAKTLGKTGTETAAPGSKEIGKIVNYNQLPVKTRAEVKAAISASQLDPIIKLNKNAYTQMGTLKEAIDSDNKALVGKLGVVFHRAMGDVGNMTAAEQVMPGSIQLLDKAKRNFELYVKSGKLDAATKKELSDAMVVMRRALLQNYNNLVEVETNQVLEQYPQLDREFVRKSIGGSLGEKDKPSKDASTGVLPQIGQQFQGGTVKSIKRID